MSGAPERPFDAPWQARAFALAVALHENGLFTWEDWTRTLGGVIGAHPERPYYESWLEAVQLIVTAHADLRPEDIVETRDAWLAAAARTPHGRPIELDPSGRSAP